MFWSKIQNNSMQKNYVPVLTRAKQLQPVFRIKHRTSCSYSPLESIWMCRGDTVVCDAHLFNPKYWVGHPRNLFLDPSIQKKVEKIKTERLEYTPKACVLRYRCQSRPSALGPREWGVRTRCSVQGSEGFRLGCRAGTLLEGGTATAYTQNRETFRVESPSRGLSNLPCPHLSSASPSSGSQTHPHCTLQPPTSKV